MRQRRYVIAHVGSAMLAVSLLGVWSVPAARASTSTTELVSLSASGEQGNDMAGRFAGPAISGDGQVVAFDSIARNLVAGDTNFVADVFVRDRAAIGSERISVSTAGVEANGSSTRPDLDLTGQHVVYDSSASNLVPDDTNALMDVFVRDRVAGTTERVSVSSDEVQGNSSSNSPSISDDGRYVAFVSTSSNLVPGDTNGVEDIFIRDLVAGTTERVSLTSTGEQGNSSTTATTIGADGRWVAFSSFASNLVPDDTNGTLDSFVHDRETGLTELVSLSSAGEQGNGLSVAPAVSADGQTVAFWSYASNLVPSDTNDRPDVFVRNRATGTTERASVADDEAQSDGNSPEAGVRGFVAEGPDITPDGRFVAFSSSATNLVPGDTNTCPLFFENPPGLCPDAFVRDLVAGTTVRVNVAADGTQANDRSVDPALSNDGSAVAFWSAANNLVPGDANTCPLFTSFAGNCPDIFVHELEAPGEPTADVAVTLQDSADPVAVGLPLRYTARVSNDGPAAATEVTLQLRVARAVQLVSATTAGGSCRQADRVVTCDLGTLAPGTRAVVAVEVTVVTPAALRATARVTAAEDDPVPADNSDVEVTTAVA